MIKEQKKVLKRHPNAKLIKNDTGNFIITVNDVILAEEYFLPDADTEEIAWYYAAMSCKTTQHFNRTHPLKIDINFGGDEAKNDRIENRKRRGRK